MTVHEYRWVLPPVLLGDGDELGPLFESVFGVTVGPAVFAWGIVVRARRQLVWSLRQRADTAAREAKRLERERIAREMHDVLARPAHRISMLTLHAGALEFRPDAPAGEIARAAGAVRTSAHHALQDLREVIGVLRQSAPTGDDLVPDRPQPTLADLPSLVEECRRAGMEVDFAGPSGEAPDGPGRKRLPHRPGVAHERSVAGEPFLSPAVTRQLITHVSRILTKLNLNNRVQVALLVYDATL